jgi:hypothetical protein
MHKNNLTIEQYIYIINGNKLNQPQINSYNFKVIVNFIK